MHSLGVRFETFKQDVQASQTPKRSDDEIPCRCIIYAIVHKVRE